MKYFKLILLSLFIVFQSCASEPERINYRVSIDNCYGCQVHDENNKIIAYSRGGERISLSVERFDSSIFYVVPTLTTNRTEISITYDEHIFVRDNFNLPVDSFLLIDVRTMPKVDLFLKTNY